MLEPVGPIDSPQDSVFETQNSALLAYYLKTKAQVDSAIRHFARTFEWPEMTPLEKFFLAARLDFGWEVASILNTAHRGEILIGYPRPEKCSSADLLEWLLIDAWPYGCGRFLEVQMEARTWAEQSNGSSSRRNGLAQHEIAKVKCVA